MALASTVFQNAVDFDNLVRMTSFSSSSTKNTRKPSGTPNTWRLQDAKARFSELVRRSHSDGPQHVTLHGKESVVVVDAVEFRRLTEARTGAALIEVLQACPYPELDLASEGVPMPVRELAW